MPIIGLTGGLGSGKSTVAEMFSSHGAVVIDADAITRRLLTDDKKCIKKVAKLFPGVILPGSKVDRLKLANIVFQHPRELNKLTKVLYPEALKQVKAKIAAYKKNTLVVLDVPLLFEAGWESLADITVVVKALRHQQLKRAMKRIGLTRQQFSRRSKNQMPLQEKARLADIIIDNSGTLAQTRRQVEALIRLIEQREHHHRRITT